MIGKIFFNKYKSIYIPVKCDDETTYTLYGEKYNIFEIWHNLHRPKEKYCVDIKAMIHSIDDGSYSIEWERELMTESFMNTHLFPMIINYIKENCECINGEKFLDFCNNIVRGLKSYD